MDDFRIIPVMDIKNGKAVHAIRGERGKYMPVNCSWCHDGSIEDLIKGYVNDFNLNDLYIADLDAIIDDKMNQDIYGKILELVPGHVMIDAGIDDHDKYIKVSEHGFQEIIIGTETIMNLDELSVIMKNKKSKIIISLDFKNGVSLSKMKEFESKNLLEILDVLAKFSPDAFIYLDLGYVGAKKGINPDALKLLKNSKRPMYLGGGIKNIDDIMKARDEGFAGVLCATAFQEMLIKPEMLAPF
ncbi:MAG: HisA/HisF-related TIM barrel protein, partial [Promethearchaeota archaeon]